MKVRTASELMKDNMIVKHYAGSIAYGTNLPSSDVDFRGLFCGDPINVRTPFFPVRECDDVGEEDTKLYELAHFMKLCLDCNPNIIETLWVDDSDVVFRTDAYDYLRSVRGELLSSKVAFTFSGYAIAQLKRIKGHNKWINNPQPEKPPVQIDFVSLVQWFGEEKVMPRDFHLNMFRNGHRLIPYSKDTFGLYKMEGYETYDEADNTLNTNFDGSREGLSQPLAVIKFNKEEYLTAKEKHQQYWEWKNNRNEKRGVLEEQFGYDTKHAMHLVRLLRMAKEILSTGEVLVKRPDAQELLDIRGGSLAYEEILAYSESMDKEIREVWYKTTKLPKKPNIKRAAEILMNVQDSMWSK